MTSTTWTQNAGMDSGTDSDGVVTYAEAAQAAAEAAAASEAAAAASESDAETAANSATTSKNASASSATAAAASASAASSSASTATAAATAAASSATTAAAAATETGSDVTAAETAAVNAASSAVNALAAETSAASSATSAASSATSANASYISAASSAVVAEDHKDAAAASATEASGYVTDASDEVALAATQASNAASSATAAAASETAAATSETNAATSATTATTKASEASASATAAASSASASATSATDSESARDQSQDARDTANLHKLAAEAAATSATNTAAALTGFDLEAIAESKSVTAVDVFVYDTSKDSDGGAWRKRTQGTSWYNETLNTATRGSRREFPAVAVIVAEADKVTIYDGDDPALPMWMVFEGSATNWLYYSTSSTETSCIFALNGKIVSGNELYDVRIWNFIADGSVYWRERGVADYYGTVSQRNNGLGQETLSSGSSGIVNRAVNDVAMTVLPDAPIDAATGLPVPTIAVATDGGVSVIKDDGTVVDITTTNSFYARVVFVDFRKDNKIVAAFGFGSNFSATRYVHVNTIPSSDLSIGDSVGTSTSEEYYAESNSYFTYNADLNINIDRTNPIYAQANGTAFGQGGGLAQVDAVPSAPETGMVAYTTSTYNTGWMNGSIKGAFLSDTDDTDLVGTELVTNGTFDTDTDWTKGTGWTISGGTANKAAGTGDAITQANTLVEGNLYVISFEVSGATAGVCGPILTGSTQITGPLLGANGSRTEYLVATSATTGYGITASATFDGSIDNISVKLADADRSVNG